MPFKLDWQKLLHLSHGNRLMLIALLWGGLITWLHFTLNLGVSGVKTIQMGYMPVITNLAAPLLDKASQGRKDIRFKALKFASFAEMGEALRSGRIQAAFIIAPLTIVLRQQGADVKLVYIGNRRESTLVVREDLPAENIKDLSGYTVAVPMRFSGHNLALQRLLDDEHLTGQVNIVEMNPPDMASALTTGSLDAYFVGEPFAAQTLISKDSRRLYNAEEIWPGFICNVMIVQKSFIDKDPKAARVLVHGAVRSGIWTSQNLTEAVKIAARYWNQSEETVNYALTHPPGRIQFDHYLPVKSEIAEIADLMVRYGLIEDANIDGLVEPGLAASTRLEGITDLASIIYAN